MASNFLRAPVLSHSQKVCRTYKRACRELQAYFFGQMRPIIVVRYHQVKLRHAIEKNRYLEPEEAKEQFAVLEKEIERIESPLRHQFPNSPGGHNYGRSQPVPDWILDTWHPLEKAEYPTYFAKRDIRKREFIERNERWIQELEKSKNA